MGTQGKIGGCASHGVLVEEVPGQVVFSSSELVAEIDELSKKVNLNTGVQEIQDTYVLEAGLVEVVAGSEEEIGWVMGFSLSDYYLKAKYVPRLILVSHMRKAINSNKDRLLDIHFAVVVGVEAARRGGFG